MAIDERGVNLKVTATNETQQGFEGVKQSAREMANTVTQESGRASQSVGKIGDGGQQASQKVERSTRSMIQSIQRTTAAMEAGSRTSAKYYETLAKQRGVDPEALRPYLNQLEEVRLKQEQASAALGAGTIQLNQYGMSAKQTAAALRGVPAQITDIVVSLQGGQRPMTVLLQQGGQLRDLFGGIVPAAQALGSTLLKMVNPLTVAAAAVGGLYVAYRTGAAEAERFHASLVLTGNAAGTSVDQLMTMASRIDSVASTQRRAASALNEFVSSSRVGVRNLEEFTLAAIKWEDATGTAISETVKQFEELARAPLEASTKLDQALGHLTGSLRDQIRELEEQGRMIDAANLAQKAFADTINERAPQIVQQIGYIEQGWRAVKSAISEAVDAMAGIGRPQTTFEQLIDAETRLQQLQDGAAERGAVRRQRQIAEQEAIVASLRGQYAVEQSILTLQQQGAEERARQQERERNLREYLGEPNRMTRAQQMQKDLEEERKIYEARRKDAAGNAQALQQIEQAHQVALRNIRERYKESSSGGISTTQTELARLNALLEAERQREEALHSVGLAQANLNEGERLAIQYAEKLKLATDAKTRSQLQANKALAEEYGARKRANDEFDKELKARQSAIDAAKKQTERLRDEIETYGMGKSAIEAMTIARLEERLAVDEALGASAGTIESLKQEIAARKELYDAMRTKEQLDAQLREWQAWEREVDRIFDQLGQSLTDALFEGGKSGRDMLKDMFKALTLRVLVQPVMGQLQGFVTQQLGGMLGFSDPRQGGIGDVLGGGFGLGGTTFGAGAVEMAGDWLLRSGIAPETGANMLMNADSIANVGNSILGYASSIFDIAEGRYGAGVGAAIGTYILPGLGTVAGRFFGSLIDDIFGDDKPDTRHAQMSHTELLGDGKVHVSTWDDRQSVESQKAAAKIAEDSINAALSLFDKIGIDAEFKRFTTLMESSILGDKQGVGSSATLRIGDLEHEIGLAIESSWTKHGYGGWSDAEMLPRLATDIQLTLLEAFQVAGDALPSMLSSMLADVDIRSLSAEQAQALAQAFQVAVEQINAMQSALQALPFITLRDVSFEVTANLIEFAGGMEALGAGVSAYYEHFYSQEEKLAWASEQMAAKFGELGLAMPDLSHGAEIAKQQYRALVESLDITTEEGQKAYATLMTLSGGFAELASGLEELRGGVVDVNAIMRERESLERQLLALQGNTEELRRRELNALNEANRGLQEHIWALERQAQAASQLASIQNQADQILGNTAAIRAREMEGILPENREWQQYLYDLQDWQQKVAEANARAQEDYQEELRAWNQLQQDVHDAFAEVRRVAEEELAKLREAARKTDDALAALAQRIAANERMIHDQISGLQGLLRGLRDVFDFLGDQIRDLRSQAGMSGMYAAQGWAVIRDAIGSGVVPEADTLRQAVEAVRNDVAGREYATGFDRDFETLVLANQLEALQGITEPQMSLAEQQLEVSKQQLTRLEETLSEAQRIVNEARGIKDNTAGLQVSWNAYTDALAQTLDQSDGFESIVAAINAGTAVSQQSWLEQVSKWDASIDMARMQHAALEALVDAGLIVDEGTQEQIDALGALLNRADDQVDLLRGVDVNTGDMGTAGDQVKKLQDLWEESAHQVSALSAIVAHGVTVEDGTVGFDQTTRNLFDALLKATQFEQWADAEIQGINKQLEWASAQYNKLMGIETNTKDIFTAMNNLSEAITGLSTTPTPTDPGTTLDPGTVAPPPITTNPDPDPPPPDTSKPGYRTHKPTDYFEARDYIFAYQDLRDEWEKWQKENGYATPGQVPLNKWIEWAQNHWIRDGHKEGRKYARGGLALPGWALVGEEGPELVNFTQPGRVYTASQTSEIMRSINGASGGAVIIRLTEKMDALVQQNARLEARLTSIDQSTGQLADQFDNVTAGGNAIAAEVMNKVEVVAA